MKYLSFNLNHYVKFRLTDEGKEVNRVYRHQLQPIDEYGYYKAQMHEVMSMFGDCFYKGRVPIEKMEIIFDVKDLSQTEFKG